MALRNEASPSESETSAGRSLASSVVSRGFRQPTWINSADLVVEVGGEVEHVVEGVEA